MPSEKLTISNAAIRNLLANSDGPMTNSQILEAFELTYESAPEVSARLRGMEKRASMKVQATMLEGKRAWFIL